MSGKSLLAVVGLAALAGSIALAQPAKENKPAQPAKPASPAKPATPSDAAPPGIPGMSEQQMQDMQVCIEAGQPGPRHAELAKAVGTWHGKNKMWMSPETKEPMTSECMQTVTSIMDGRFIKIEVKGDMGGMPFHGFGITGFDNVSQKYVSSWIDNMGSGITHGTGEPSSDGKTITFTYNYNCPITKKPAVMREIHTHKGPDAFTLTMYGKEPRSGVEFKMMEIEFTRQANTEASN